MLSGTSVGWRGEFSVRHNWTLVQLCQEEIWLLESESASVGTVRGFFGATCLMDKPVKPGLSLARFSLAIIPAFAIPGVGFELQPEAGAPSKSVVTLPLVHWLVLKSCALSRKLCWCGRSSKLLRWVRLSLTLDIVVAGMYLSLLLWVFRGTRSSRE